ncbi:TraB/GumN family protein [Veronia nyctiphanis]|nr:TraB/GumN family protein [Veronia nyctiphanis]
MKTGKALNHLIKGILSVSLISTAVAVHAESAVWEVSKGDDVVYLGGTIHALPSSAYPLPPAYDAAYQKSQEVIFEVTGLDNPDLTEKVIAHGVYHDGSTLSSKLRDNTKAQLDKAMQGYGMGLSQVDVFKPGMLLSQLTMFEMQKIGADGQGVDAFFENKANSDGKPVSGLETVEEQLTFLSELGKDNEDAFIRKMLEDLPEFEQQMDELMVAWRKGDMKALELVINQDTKENYPALYQNLIVERNNNWMPKIERLFGDDNTEFVLVGAGHLSGDVGLLKQLADKGYNLKQL